MQIQDIFLSSFRNIKEVHLSFSTKMTAIVGVNGSGKTNILEAIHFLSLTKAYLNNQDAQSIAHNEQYFRILGNFKQKENYKIELALQLGQKKILKVNGGSYAKISEHIGRFPLVAMHPQDVDLIREGSDERRRFLDNLICQCDQNYLENLLHYNYHLKQRNALLKQFSRTGLVELALLEPYDHFLQDLGKYIYTIRKEFILLLFPFFKSFYDALAPEEELSFFQYTSDHQEGNYIQKFQHALKKDLILERTTVGIHTDDLVFKMNEHLVKRFSSQGQQKTFIIALKFAQYALLAKHKEHKPILLLDDILDKLDDKRIEKLMQLLQDPIFGQVILTDARPERTRSFFDTQSHDISWIDASQFKDKS